MLIMKRLKYYKKIELMSNLCEKHNITAYEIGKNTNLDVSGVHKILTKETQKPREKTINTILEYIASRIVGSNIPGHENYVEKNNIEERAEEYISEAKHYKNEILIEIHKLKLSIDADHKLIKKSMEISLLDAVEIKDQGKILLTNTSEIKESFDTLAEVINKRLS